MIDLREEGDMISCIYSLQTQMLVVSLSIVIHILCLGEGDDHPLKLSFERGGRGS